MPKRLKPLRPTMREKKRYVAFEAMTPRVLPIVSINEAIRHAAQQLLGDLGLAAMGLQFIPERAQGHKGLLRVSHRYLDHARAAIAFVTSVKKTPVALRSLGASGILAKAHKKYILN